MKSVIHQVSDNGDGTTLVSFTNNEPRPVTVAKSPETITLEDVKQELARIDAYTVAVQHTLIGQTVVTGPDVGMFYRSVAATFGTAQAGTWLDTLKATVRALDADNLPLARVSLDDALTALVIDVATHLVLVQLGIDAGLWSA